MLLGIHCNVNLIFFLIALLLFKIHKRISALIFIQSNDIWSLRHLWLALLLDQLRVTGKMSKSDVKRLSQLADDYRDRSSHNSTENWSDLLKVR